MLPILAILTITAVFVSFVLNKTVLPLLRIARINRRLAKEGTDADAVLLNLEPTGLYINKQPQIKLQVQVHPLVGRNFVSEVCEVLTPVDLSGLRVGSTLKVKYNPANTKEVMVLRRQTSSSFHLDKSTTQ